MQGRSEPVRARPDGLDFRTTSVRLPPSYCLTREAAARFAFLLAVPVILAAGILGMFDIVGIGLVEVGLWPMIVGFAVSLISGYFAVRTMIRFLRVRKLYIFSVYLIALGIVIFLLSNLM